MVAIVIVLAAGCSSSPPRHDHGTGAPGSRAAYRSPQGEDRAQHVARQALSYVGVPYRYGGTSASSGFDCSGLVWRVYRQAAGITLPRDTFGISRASHPISSRQLQAGDLVFFNTLRRPYSHVGIYVGNGRFVHAPKSGGVVSVARLSDRYWRQRFNGGRRIAF